MRGTGLMGGADYGNFQIEITIVFLFLLFCVMAFWVYYDSDNYFVGIKKHLFWPLTLLTGPIGLTAYIYMRRKADY